MRVALARFVFVTLCSLLATVLGGLTALTLTPAGRDVVAQSVVHGAARVLRGSIRLGSLSGNFVRTLTLDDLQILDTAGTTVVSFDRLRLAYDPADFLLGRVVFASVRAETPVMWISQRPSGVMNWEEVLRLGENPGGPPSPLIEIRNLVVTDGNIEIRSPWSLPGHLRGAARDSAWVDEQQKPGREFDTVSTDGVIRVRRFERVQAEIPLLRIATPERDPLFARIASLAAWISDPGIDLRDLEAEVMTAGDSLVFTLDRGQLPATRVSGEGRITWPADTVLFDFRMEAPQVALRDLRWITPNFPNLTGRGRVEALSRSGMQVEYDIRDLHLSDDVSAVDGQLIAIKHQIRGLGVRNLDVQLRQFDLDLARRFLDTLPFAGTLTGPLRGSGFLTAMRLRTDLIFQDHTVPDRPSNLARIDGRIRFGGPDGIVFDSTDVIAADLDLATVRRMAPAVRLEGRLALGGMVDGPWRNATFTGTAEHRIESIPPSLAQGSFRFDGRDTTEVVIDVDADLAPLRFDLLRPTFPDFTLQGTAVGHVRIQGTMDSLSVEGDVNGAVGRVRGHGVIGLGDTTGAWTAERLDLEFTALDLEALRNAGVSTRLTGALTARGVVVSDTLWTGSGLLSLNEGRIGGIPLDSAVFRGSLIDDLLTVDTVGVSWEGGFLAGGGALGWTGAREGQLTLRSASRGLALFDSTLDVLTGFRAEDDEEHEGLDGRYAMIGVVQGSLDDWTGAVQVNALEARRHETSSTAMRGLATLSGGRTRTTGFDLFLEADSLRTARLSYPIVTVTATGTTDSLAWSVAPVDPAGRTGWLGGHLAVEPQTGAVRVWLDSLRLDLPAHTWTLGDRGMITVTDEGVTVARHSLATRDGGGQISLEGSLPVDGTGTFDLSAVGVAIEDVYAVLQRDPSTVSGISSMDVNLTGTARQPVIRGTGSITGGVFGDFRAPFGRTAFYYTDEVLSANLSFFRTGRTVVEVDARLPVNLALAPTPDRERPGPIAIRARTDSLDLGVLEAFTPNLRQVMGQMAVDVTVDGTWERPRLGGSIEIDRGRVRVPALGVSYGPIVGAIHLAGDSVLVDSLRIGNRSSGFLDVGGGIRLERLTQPALGLTLHAERFAVLDVPDFLRLRATADMDLRGTLLNPVMTGRGTVRNSVLYFSDLLTKDIVNLDDPLNADLIDTAAIRRARLSAPFQSRFLDSLLIQRLELRVAEDVWLRSAEANVQLEGTVIVDKGRQRNYLISGALDAPRGSYTLKLGPVTRDFTVTRGTVRYFGTPDLNAELDIEARHLIRSNTAQAEDLPIVAHIEGTLLVPRLRLESATQTTLSQSDLMTVLLFGGEVNQQSALTAAASVLSAEIQRSLVANQSPGAPDLLEIRPGAVGRGEIRGINQIQAGWQLGERWFVSLNAGFCFNQQNFDYRSFGASLEYRLSRDWRLQVSAEPVQFCGTSRAVNFLDRNRYQFGGDLRWDREF